MPDVPRNAMSGQVTTRLGRVGLNPKKAYAEEETYNRLDVVTYKNAGWICLKDGTTKIPPADGDNWMKLVDTSVLDSAESQRQTDEAARKSAETARDTAEEERASAETARKAAETARDTAEQTRKANEDARVKAEQARADAEEQRATDTQGRLDAMDAATAKVDGLTVDAETIEAGLDADATLSTPDGHYHIHFSVPKGDQGVQGVQGDQGPKGDPGEVTTEQLEAALAAKQDTLTFDDAPAAESDNPVKSKGIKGAIDAKVDKITATQGDVIIAGANGALADSGKKYNPDAKTDNATTAVTVDANGKLWCDTVSHNRYTVCWDMVKSEMIRLNNAAGITTDTTHFAHHGSVDAEYNNPFDNIYPWNSIKLCNIDVDKYMKLTSGQSITECVTAWEGDPDFKYEDQYGVWRYSPEFWGRSWEEGGKRYFEITDAEADGYIYYPEAIKGRWHGVKKNLNIGETGAKDYLLPICDDVPEADTSTVAQLHQYATNGNMTLDNIYSVDADLLLYVVEFANMNAQVTLGGGVDAVYQAGSKKLTAAVSNSTTVKINTTDKGPAQVGANFTYGPTNDRRTGGGAAVIKSIGADEGGVTTITLDRAVTITADQYWNIHGMSNTKDVEIGGKSGYIGADHKSIAYYRGLELYGNMYFYTLGAYRETGTDKIWIAKDATVAQNSDALPADNKTDYIDTGCVLPRNSGKEASNDDGWIGKLGICAGLSVPPFCTGYGGNDTAPVGDYCWTPAKSLASNIMLRGALAYSGLGVGPFAVSWRDVSSGAWWGRAARCALKIP